MSGIRNSSEFNDPDGEYLDDAEAEYDASYLVYIYHKNDGSLDEGHTYWECSKRRQSR